MSGPSGLALMNSLKIIIFSNCMSYEFFLFFLNISEISLLKVVGAEGKKKIHQFGHWQHQGDMLKSTGFPHRQKILDIDVELLRGNA